MMSRIANSIEEKHRSDPKVGVAFVRAGHLRSVENVLLAILRQLYEKQPSSLDQDTVSRIGKTSFSREQINKAIRCCASRMSNVFIFIDAIDEFPAAMGSGPLVDLLECQAQTGASMVLTSTSNDSRLAHNQTFKFRAHDDDISKYIENETRYLHSGLLQGNALPDVVFRKILDISNGV